MQIAIYADRIRGRYPVWQSLDHDNFFPGSGVLFATVTVRLSFFIRLGYPYRDHS